jgi:hypothetical protein
VTNPGPTTPGTTTPGTTTPGTTTPGTTTPGNVGSASGTSLPSPKSLSLTLKPARDRAKPYAFTLSGKLGLPAGVTTAKGCSGKVTITAKRGVKTVFSKAVFLKKDCTYSIKANITGKGKLKFSVKFAGNSALGSKASAAISARAG